MKRVLWAVLVLAMLVMPRTSEAASFGFYGGLAGPAITAAGHTPVALTDLTAADLAGLDVLWILNSDNGGLEQTILDNLAAIAEFVRLGGVLSFHDRFVAGDQTDIGDYLPGMGGTTFVRDVSGGLSSTSIDVVDPNHPVVNGPAGLIGNATLDGGNESNHGYALLATLPAGAVPVLTTNDSTHIVDFYFQFGAGWVYYSTIPLDFYFGGSGNNPPADQFRNIYGVNEAAFQASLGVRRGAAASDPHPLVLRTTELSLASLGSGPARPFSLLVG
jgi:hypothetical protein